MSEKKFFTGFILAVMLFSAAPLFAQQVPVPAAPRNVASTLKGMNITIGNWWASYDVNTYNPRNDYETKQLDYRKRLTSQYRFTMANKNVSSWNNMALIASSSIMAGKPAATVFLLQPDWALSLYKQNLLYPISNARSVDWTSISPVMWNRSAMRAFSFSGGTYGFADGYGGSQHAVVVFFNKRLFREAGLDPHLLYDLQKEGTWTWDKFVEVSRRLTRDTNNDGIMDTYAMAADLSTEILDALVSSNGAAYVNKNREGKLVSGIHSPAFIEAVAQYMRWRDAGIMKPKPVGDNVPWNWHIPEFNDGRVAMRIDQHYLATNDLRNMKDEWGMVLPPKGPRVRNYVVFNDENVMVIPAQGFTDAQVNAIVWAVQAWVTPVEDNWRLQEYPTYRDRRAVDETVALIRDQRLWKWRYHLHVPGLNRGNIAWEIWWHSGQPAQLVEAVSQSWNALIAEANNIN